jgi:hypothetical protein
MWWASSRARVTAVLVDDAEVAPRGELDPARVAVAVDGGDDGLVGIEPREAHRPRVVGPPMLEELRHPLEVGSRAERPVASTRDDEDLGVVVRRERVDGVRHQHGGLVVDVVVHLGAVQGEDGDGISPIHQQLRHTDPFLIEVSSLCLEGKIVSAVVDDFHARFRAESLETNPAPGCTFAERERRRTELYVAFHYADPLARIIVHNLHLDADVAAMEARHRGEMVRLAERVMASDRPAARSRPTVIPPSSPP